MKLVGYQMYDTPVTDYNIWGEFFQVRYDTCEVKSLWKFFSKLLVRKRTQFLMFAFQFRVRQYVRNTVYSIFDTHRSLITES